MTFLAFRLGTDTSAHENFIGSLRLLGHDGRHELDESSDRRVRRGRDCVRSIGPPADCATTVTCRPPVARIRPSPA